LVDIRQAFEYNPDTGVFIRLESAGNVKAGSVAGSLDTKGYLRVFFNDKRYKCHRLAWYFTYGEWPKQVIDHINGNKTDNRISNLRDVSNKENCNNRHRANRNSQTGITNIFPQENGYRYKTKVYKTLEEALHVKERDNESRIH